MQGGKRETPGLKASLPYTADGSKERQSLFLFFLGLEVLGDDGHLDEEGL